MRKKVVIISTSFRENGNSDILTDQFQEGALKAGHEVKKIVLKNKKVQFCRGCLICQNTQKCLIQDDVKEILQLISSADVLVFATPIYFYEMSGQMKTFLDRMNPLFQTPYRFRDIYLIATAADTDEQAIEGAKRGLEGWINCFDLAKLKGVVCGVSLTNRADALSRNDYLKQSYDFGLNC